MAIHVLFCEVCRSPVEQSARFCGACGSPIQAVIPENHPVPRYFHGIARIAIDDLVRARQVRGLLSAQVAEQLIEDARRRATLVQAATVALDPSVADTRTPGFLGARYAPLGPALQAWAERGEADPAVARQVADLVQEASRAMSAFDAGSVDATREALRALVTLDPDVLPLLARTHRRLDDLGEQVAPALGRALAGRGTGAFRELRNRHDELAGFGETAWARRATAWYGLYPMEDTGDTGDTGAGDAGDTGDGTARDLGVAWARDAVLRRALDPAGREPGPMDGQFVEGLLGALDGAGASLGTGRTAGLLRTVFGERTPVATGQVPGAGALVAVAIVLRAEDARARALTATRMADWTGATEAGQVTGPWLDLVREPGMVDPVAVALATGASDGCDALVSRATAVATARARWEQGAAPPADVARLLEDASWETSAQLAQGEPADPWVASVRRQAMAGRTPVTGPLGALAGSCRQLAEAVETLEHLAGQATVATADEAVLVVARQAFREALGTQGRGAEQAAAELDRWFGTRRGAEVSRQLGMLRNGQDVAGPDPLLAGVAQAVRAIRIQEATRATRDAIRPAPPPRWDLHGPWAVALAIVLLVFAYTWNNAGNPLYDLRKIPFLEHATTAYWTYLAFLLLLGAGSWALVNWLLAPWMAPADPPAQLPASPSFTRPAMPGGSGPVPATPDTSPWRGYLLPVGNGVPVLLVLALMIAVTWPIDAITAGPPPDGTPAVRFDEKGNLGGSPKRTVATGTFVPDCRGSYLRSKGSDPETLDALATRCAGSSPDAQATFIAAIATANPGVARGTTFRYGQVVTVPTIVPTPTARPTAIPVPAAGGYTCDAPPDKEGFPTYTVVGGDTLNRIVQKCQGSLTLEKIKELNPKYKPNPDDVKPGDKVKLPNPPTPPTTFAATGTFTLQVGSDAPYATGTFRVLAGSPQKEVASATFAPGKAQDLSAKPPVPVGPGADATFQWAPGDGGSTGELVYGDGDQPDKAKRLAGASVAAGSWTVWVRSTGTNKVGSGWMIKVGSLEVGEPGGAAGGQTATGAPQTQTGAPQTQTATPKPAAATVPTLAKPPDPGR